MHHIDLLTSRNVELAVFVEHSYFRTGLNLENPENDFYSCANNTLATINENHSFLLGLFQSLMHLCSSSQIVLFKSRPSVGKVTQIFVLTLWVSMVLQSSTHTS